MTAYGQIRRFIEDMEEAIHDAIGLTTEDPERSRRVLRALQVDLATLTDLLEKYRPLQPSDDLRPSSGASAQPR